MKVLSLLIASLLLLSAAGCDQLAIASIQPPDYRPLAAACLALHKTQPTTPDEDENTKHARSSCPTNGWITQGDGHKTRCQDCEPPWEARASAIELVEDSEYAEPVDDDPQVEGDIPKWISDADEESEAEEPDEPDASDGATRTADESEVVTSWIDDEADDEPEPQAASTSEPSGHWENRTFYRNERRTRGWGRRRQSYTARVPYTRQVWVADSPQSSDQVRLAPTQGNQLVVSES